MADLFISHSHQDVLAARDLRALLEAVGYTCWMAPDDVTGAVPWAEQILNAIDASRVMIVLLSKAANDSNHVSKEVGLALERDKALLPVRVEEVMPTGSLQYLLQLVQWVDAFPGPMKDHLAQVRRSVASVVPAPAEFSAATATGSTPVGPHALPAAPPTGAPPHTPAPAGSPPASPSAAPAGSMPHAAPGQPELMPHPPQSTWATHGAPPAAATAVSAATSHEPSVHPAGAVPPAPPAAAIGAARSGGNPNQRTVLASVAIIAVAVVVAAVILGGGLRSEPAASPTPTTAAIASPTTVPTGTATPRPTDTPTAAPTPTSTPPAPPTTVFPNAAEADLLDHVPQAIRSTCRPALTTDHLRATADAVVDCYPRAASSPNFVRYGSFPTLQAMDGIFNADVTFAGDRAVSGVKCSESPFTGGLGTYGRNDVTVGQILCYLDGNTAWLEWTYEPGLVWVSASRGDGDAESLYDWWSNVDSAGPLD